MTFAMLKSVRLNQWSAKQEDHCFAQLDASSHKAHRSVTFDCLKVLLPKPLSLSLCIYIYIYMFAPIWILPLPANFRLVITGSWTLKLLFSQMLLVPNSFLSIYLNEAVELNFAFHFESWCVSLSTFHLPTPFPTSKHLFIQVCNL